MANKAPEPLPFHLAELTASQFLDIWNKFDADGNGCIEGKELEHFIRELELARKSAVSHVQKYDTDRSGYIEANELKGFLSDLLKKANRHYDDKKLNEYTQTILKMFDLNGDGKLGLSEMARLLPVQENFLLKFQNFKLSAEEFEAIFTYYDKDGNGYIDEHELDALLRDLYQKHKMVADPQNLSSSKKSIMVLSDGGKLFRTELEIVLCKDPSV
uniref:Calretinin-like n=1 Tax=Sinocyclocheilus grahami TaxID=75366 RepID=A0A672RRE0_SINGR